MRLLALMLLTVALYAHVGTYGFVYEDSASMNIPRAFDELSVGHIFPSRVLSAATLAGNYPRFQHLFNLALHLANGWLVYELAKRLFWPTKPALLVAGLFLLHPIQVEAVAYVSGRADLLMTFYVLMSISFMLDRNWTMMLATLLMALMSKEAAVVSVGLLPLAWVASGRSLSKNILWGTGVASVVILGAKATYLLSDQAMWTGQPGLAFLSFWRMVGLAVVPYGFSVEHVYPVSWWLSIPAIIGVVVLAGIAVVASRKRPMVAFGLAWMLIALLPRFMLRQVEPINEHQIYMPFIGLWFVIGDLVGGVPSTRQS